MKHPYIAQLVTTMFTEETVMLHGFSTSIVSDEDKMVLSLFWNELFKTHETFLDIGQLTIHKLMDQHSQ